MNKKWFSLALTLSLCLAMSAVCLAADDFGMTEAFTSGINEIKTQVLAVIAIVLPVVLTLAGGKIAITKGLSYFKSLASK